MWTGRTLAQIEEPRHRFGGEKCCATSEDRRAGKQRDGRELEQKVIQTHVCPHDHRSSLATHGEPQSLGFIICVWVDIFLTFRFP